MVQSIRPRNKNAPESILARNKLDFEASKLDSCFVPLFTSETAAIAGKAGAMARWHSPKADPVPVIVPPAAAIPEKPSEKPVGFVGLTLVRVRDRLSDLYGKLEHETDPACIDRLCAAIAKLHEVERQLDGRPLPGSRKPAPERSQDRQRGAWLLEPSKPPAQVQTPQAPSNCVLDATAGCMPADPAKSQTPQGQKHQ